MRLSKLFTLVMCSALIPGAALAQKKDKMVPAVAETAQITPYSNVRRDNLLNGLQVVTLDRQSDAVVKCDLIIRGGAMFDLAGKAGLAALTLESLMIVNPRVKEELESLNAKADWGVTSDTTWLHLEAPTSSFGLAMEIVARLLVVENVRPEAFKIAKVAQIAKAKAAKPTPAEQADAEFLKAIYGDHPYGHNTLGNEKTLAEINQGEVYDFFRRFYIANNASAVVVGNIAHGRVMQLFKLLFGGWVKGQIVPATFRQPLQTSQVRVVKVELPDVANVELRGGLIGVKHTDPDFLTTEVIARIVNNRLKNEPAATNLSVKSAQRILAGPFYYSASVAADKAPELSRRASEAFTSLAGATVSANELAEAKSELASELAARPIEHNLRDIEMFLLPRNLPVDIGKKIEAISAADVQRVAKRLLDANALTVVVVGKVNEAFNFGKTSL